MRKSQKRIHAGEQYGCILVLDASANRTKPKRWDCRCLRCGSDFTEIGANILEYQDIGCPTCRRAAKEKDRAQAASEYIGAQFGFLEVTGFAGFKMSSGANIPVMRCICKKCGNETEIPLARLKAGQATQCAGCGRQNLAAGRKIIKNACVDNTNVIDILPGRKINKNSVTGINGVSFCQGTGKYRAYIVFRRRQYHLGVYDKIEDAAAARDAGEEHLYGDFIKWYAETYPEKWDQIVKKSDNKNEQQ